MSNFKQGNGLIVASRYQRDPFRLGGRFNATIDTMEIPLDAGTIESPRDLQLNAVLCDVPYEGLNASSIMFQAVSATGAITAAGRWQFAFATVSASNGYPKRVIAGTKSTAATFAAAWNTTLGTATFSWATPARITHDMLYSGSTLGGLVYLLMMCEEQYTGSAESAPALRAYTCRGPAIGDSINFQNSLGAVWTGSTPTFGTFPGEAADIDTNANWGPLNSAPGSGTNEPGHFMFAIDNAPFVL